jgi:hypothetical protein
MAPPQPQRLCDAPITAATHPLSALNAPLVHTGHNTLTTVASARAGQTLQHVRSTRSTALGWGTYGGCVVGDDGRGLLLALRRQVRRLLARRCRFSKPLMVGSNNHHSTPPLGVHSTTQGHLGVNLLTSEGGLSGVWVGEPPSCVSDRGRGRQPGWCVVGKLC